LLQLAIDALESMMIRRRIYEIIGTLIIGDGFAFLFAPRPHMLIWVEALKIPVWQRLVQWFADHASAARVTGVIEIALGSWIVAQAYRDVG
jgi:hypothetical protein